MAILFRTILLNYYMRQAKKMAYAWPAFGLPTLSQRLKASYLQDWIINLQKKLHVVADFDAMIKDVFPDIAMASPWLNKKVERRTFKTLDRELTKEERELNEGHMSTSEGKALLMGRNV